MRACSISNIFFPLISYMLLKANYTLLSNTIFPVIYSIPPFPVGRVEGVSTPRKTWNIDKQYSQIVLLAPRQDGNKQGRKRSHSTWFVADRWTVFPWVWASMTCLTDMGQSGHMAEPTYLGPLGSVKRLEIQSFTTSATHSVAKFRDRGRIGTNTGLKTDSSAVFESSRLVTAERWSSRRTALASPIRVSISFHLPSFGNISRKLLELPEMVPSVFAACLQRALIWVSGET